MHPMTVTNLQSAFAGESQAHMRYLIFADKAEKDGFPNVARLFRAIAWAEQIHATSHFNMLRDEKGAAQTVAGAGFGLGSTADNLGTAIEGEDFEVAEMYPAYKAVAELQEEKRALHSFDWAWKAEQTHAALYKEAKKAVESGKDYDIEAIYICPRCGHTVVGTAPDRCPICNAPGEMYKSF
ncbi:MAG: rubrerythrin family protein [Anaerolineae bacterium]|nr:rubrerythrin family protein [Anaerolineae bacterium]